MRECALTNKYTECTPDMNYICYNYMKNVSANVNAKLIARHKVVYALLV